MIAPFKLFTMFIRNIPLYKYDVFGIGTAIGGTASAAGQVISSMYAADKQLDATRETNEANKQLAAERNALEYQIFGESNEFNAEQAQLSREHALMMQKDAQAYNSIGAQIDRARAAGVNPAAVVNGSGTTAVGASPSSAVASSSPPNMVAAQMQTPDLSALQGISQAFNNMGQSFQAFASAKKINAETKGVESYNKFADKINEAGLNLTKSEIRKNFASALQIQSDTDLLKQKVAESKQYVSLMVSQGKHFDEQAFGQQIENAFKSKEMDLRVKNLAAELSIKEQDAKYLMQTFSARVYGVNLQNQKSISEIVQNQAHAKYLEENLELIAAQTRLTGAQAVLTGAQTALTNSQTGLTDTQISHSAFDLQLKRVFAAKEHSANLRNLEQSVDTQVWNNSAGVRAFNILCDGAGSFASLLMGGGAFKGATAAMKRAGGF